MVTSGATLSSGLSPAKSLVLTLFVQQLLCGLETTTLRQTKKMEKKEMLTRSMGEESTVQVIASHGDFSSSLFPLVLARLSRQDTRHIWLEVRILGLTRLVLVQY